MERTMGWGRYKNGTIKDALTDQNYKNWLKDQSWLFFKDRDVYEMLHHQTEQHPPTIYIPNQPTPEHNRIQNKFLEQTYCSEFLNKHVPRRKWDRYEIQTEFEENGWDVVLSTEEHETRTYIEIKTSMSDEYPNILRKMKQQIQQTPGKARFFLFIQKFNSVNTDRSTIQIIFRNSGIRVVFGDES